MFFFWDRDSKVISVLRMHETNVKGLRFHEQSPLSSKSVHPCGVMTHLAHWESSGEDGITLRSRDN